MSEENKDLQQPENNTKNTGVSRRDFLKNAGLTIGGIAIGGGIVGSLVNPKSKENKTTTEHTMTENYNQALMFFTKEQFQVIEAASEQIFPKTDVGPGAKELLVAYFIDHQLAGNYGLNAKEYMSGPFFPKEASPEMGYQIHLNRQQIFELGIKGLVSEAQKRFKSTFYDLNEEQQIEILTDFEAGKVDLHSAASSKMFFNLLKSATIEGVYSDPLYGGNKDMQGWKMKNYPGHQGSYANIIDKDEFVKIEPQSLNSQHKH